MWKLLDVAKVLFLNKQGANKGDLAYVLKDLIEHQKRVNALVGPKGEGPLSCVWKDRDEVNKFMTAIDNLANETRLLREEIQRDRQARANGK